MCPHCLRAVQTSQPTHKGSDHAAPSHSFSPDLWQCPHTPDTTVALNYLNYLQFPGSTAEHLLLSQEPVPPYLPGKYLPLFRKDVASTLKLFLTFRPLMECISLSLVYPERVLARQPSHCINFIYFCDCPPWLHCTPHGGRGYIQTPSILHSTNQLIWIIVIQYMLSCISENE